MKKNLCEAQNLATQVEGVAEAGLLALLGGERLDGLEVEVVVEVEVVEVLAVDEEVEHVVALAADLEAALHPVEGGRLEELGGLEGAEEEALLLGLGVAVVEGVEDVVLEQLLVGDAHLDGVRGRAVLAVPGLDERHVEGAARASRPLVVGAARPEQRDPVRRVVVVQGRV